MIRTLKLATAAAALLALAACGDGSGGGSSGARSGIWSAGSSTVFPFATRVAENFARTAGRYSRRLRMTWERVSIRVTATTMTMAMAATRL